ncbi:hypothetical protein PINS_up007647 [Pythium insidiosum]|nr:hypothetical protein PINS_up007647 [Pythium insidiosum]
MATMPVVRRTNDSVHTFGAVPIRAPVAAVLPTPPVPPMPSAVTSSASAAGVPSRASVEPPPDAFVVLEQPATRHERLAELRQRKLQQLQKARDDALKKKSASRAPVVAPAPALQPVLPTHTTPASTTGATAAVVAPMAAASTRGVTRPSNRQLIQNAIEFTLLAGGSLERARSAALQAIAASTCDNFVVLLKSAKELKFRALYEHRLGSGGDDTNAAAVVRVYATSSSAPPVLTEDAIGQFFRYNSGKKEFTPIDARSFTVRTDACALRDALVFTSKKPTTAWSRAIL